MVGAFGKQAFDELQAEGNGLAHEFRVIVAGKGGTRIGQGVAQLVDGVALYGAPAADSNETEGETKREDFQICAPHGWYLSPAGG